ncbi:MAG: hypothetical protein K6C13_06745 [Oscillospiraceae bacterium]|nr:hypothetical protein [Oscillospiraceae bacterium]
MAEKTVSSGRKDSPRESESMKYLDREYIDSYRKWRRQSGNEFAFYHDTKNAETTYRDGMGIIREYPESAEKEALNGANNLLIFVLFMFVSINMIGELFIPMICNRYGIVLSSGYVSMSFSGNEKAVYLATLLMAVVSRTITFIYFKIKVKMPLKVMFPMKVTDTHFFVLALPAAVLAVSLGFCMNSEVNSVLEYIGMPSSQTYSFPDDQVIGILMFIMTLVIIPALNELFLHGAALQVLRQFGDAYALLVTALLTALSAQNLRMGAYLLMNSIIIGYFTLRSGSTITAVVMRVITEIFYHVLTITSYSPAKTVNLIAAVCMTMSITFICLYQKKHNDRISLPIKDTFLSEKEKALQFITSPGFIIWFSVCLSVMLLKLRAE